MFTQHLRESHPSCNTAEEYRAMRQTVRDYGLTKFKAEMTESGAFTVDGLISSETNPFARIIAGKVTNPCSDVVDDKRFVLLSNRPESDEHWDSTDPNWVGKASMSKMHKFLSPVDDRWSTFNVLTLGMNDSPSLPEAIAMLEEMKKTALSYAEQHSKNVELFFHCYPFNSVQTLHLHLIDRNAVGPTYSALAYKHLSWEHVVTVLREELRVSFWLAPVREKLHLVNQERATEFEEWYHKHFELKSLVATSGYVTAADTQRKLVTLRFDTDLYVVFGETFSERVPVIYSKGKVSKDYCATLSGLSDESFLGFFAQAIRFGKSGNQLILKQLQIYTKYYLLSRACAANTLPGLECGDPCCFAEVTDFFELNNE